MSPSWFTKPIMVIVVIYFTLKTKRGLHSLVVSIVRLEHRIDIVHDKWVFIFKRINIQIEKKNLFYYALHLLFLTFNYYIRNYFLFFGIKQLKIGLSNLTIQRTWGQSPILKLVSMFFFSPILKIFWKTGKYVDKYKYFSWCLDPTTGIKDTISTKKEETQSPLPLCNVSDGVRGSVIGTTTHHLYVLRQGPCFIGREGTHCNTSIVLRGSVMRWGPSWWVKKAPWVVGF